MKNIRLFIAAFALWLVVSPLFGQSLTITKEFAQVPMASVLAMYKNQFGKWEKPDLDDTFPYVVIRVGLDGDGREVQAAKKQLNLYLGQMTAVESVYKDNSNELLFLIPVRSRNIQMDCGDGCDRVTLMDGSVPLRSNTVYYGRVHFVPMATDSVYVSSGPQIYPFNLRVEPAHAKVEINTDNEHREWKLTDGVISVQLTEGEYHYTISAEDYHTASGTIHIPTYQTDTTIRLRPTFGWLTISSDSMDLQGLSAIISHDRKKERQPLPMEKTIYYPGNYTISIEKEKYHPYREMISVDENCVTTVCPVLVPKGAKGLKVPKVAKVSEVPKVCKRNTFILAEAGVALNPEWGVGLMFGQMYNGVGWYVKGRSNWNIPKKDQYGGKVFNTTKETTSIEWIVDAGLVVDFLMKKEKKDKDNFLGLYVGAGYGSRERYWLNKFKYGVIYPANSYKGVSANIGMISSWHGITFMAGVNTLAFKYMEVEAGIGYTF